MTATTSIVSSARLLLCAAIVMTAPALHAQDGMMHDAKAMHGQGTHSQNTDAAGVAVKGYDMMAYHTQRAAVAGAAAFVATHEGATYRFVSAANRAVDR